MVWLLNGWMTGCVWHSLSPGTDDSFGRERCSLRRCVRPICFGWALNGRKRNTVSQRFLHLQRRCRIGSDTTAHAPLPSRLATCTVYTRLRVYHYYSSCSVSSDPMKSDLNFPGLSVG